MGPNPDTAWFTFHNSVRWNCYCDISFHLNMENPSGKALSKPTKLIRYKKIPKKKRTDTNT